MIDPALSIWFAGRLKDTGLGVGLRPARTRGEVHYETQTFDCWQWRFHGPGRRRRWRQRRVFAVDAALQAILANPKVVKTLDDLKADDARTLEEQKRITEIPAPPFKEKVRAEYYLKRMQELGFKDAAIDSEGNVIALRKGTGGGRPKLVVSAHLDTVFPEGTDVTVKEKDGAIIAPGIGDNSRGLAALLSLVKAMNENGIATVGDIMFVGTVGEEELGNLRGVKALFRDHKDIDGFISIDGLGITRVVNQATGSHRYEFTSRAPAGTLSRSSACRARSTPWAARLQRSPSCSRRPIPRPPSRSAPSAAAPRSTPSRPKRGWRSTCARIRTEELLKLEARLLDLVKEAVADENARWKSDKMSVEVRLIGDRPAGIVSMDSPIVQATQRAVAAITRAPRATFAGSSTNSNIAMSLGIPAVTIGGGGEGGNWHSRNEWYKPTDAWMGPQNALLTVLMLSGLDGVTKPALAVRAGK